LLSKY